MNLKELNALAARTPPTDWVNLRTVLVSTLALSDEIADTEKVSTLMAVLDKAYEAGRADYHAKLDQARKALTFHALKYRADRDYVLCGLCGGAGSTAGAIVHTNYCLLASNPEGKP